MFVSCPSSAANGNTSSADVQATSARYPPPSGSPARTPHSSPRSPAGQTAQPTPRASPGPAAQTDGDPPASRPAAWTAAHAPVAHGSSTKRYSQRAQRSTSAHQPRRQEVRAEGGYYRGQGTAQVRVDPKD